MRLDDGRFGDAVDLEQARLTFTDDQELSLRRIQTPELRFLGERPERGRVVLSGARVVNLVDRAASWPGPGRLRMAGFTYETLSRRAPSRWPSGWSGWRRPPPSTPRSRTSSWPPRCGTAVRTPTRARCCWPSSGAGVRRCRSPASCGGSSRTGRWPTATAPGGPRCGWPCCGRPSSVVFSTPPPAAQGRGGTAWNAPLYALDLLLPVIDLGQGGSGSRAAAASGWPRRSILLGWVLATTVAAGATRLLRRS